MGPERGADPNSDVCERSAARAGHPKELGENKSKQAPKNHDRGGGIGAAKAVAKPRALVDAPISSEAEGAGHL